MNFKNYLIGNWKLYKTKSEIEAFFKIIKTDFKGSVPNTGLAICVSPSHMDFAVRLAPKEIEVFSQNVAYALEGALTGEISAKQLVDLGVRGSLVGHSERRQFFGDTHDTVAKRARVGLESGLKIVFCVGETLAERESEKTLSVLEAQLDPLFSQEFSRELLKSSMESGLFWVAYEPVWAIGTGKTASPKMAEESHQMIHQIFKKQNLPSPYILYGGSVKPENFKDLMAEAHISGGLVGGASLEASSYLTLLGCIG